MTQEEIIRMAREADDYADEVIQMPGEYHPDWHTVRDERFAALVAEATKEKAAKMCEEYAGTLYQWTDKRKVFAAAIRSMK